MIQELTLSLLPHEASDDAYVRRALVKKALPEWGQLNDWKIARRSIDARKSPVRMNLGIVCAFGKDKRAAPQFTPVSFPPLPTDAPQVIIVGAGPAGLFAALKAVELGWKPVVVERGKDVDARRLDITALNRTLKVDGDSNYCFGEGGAGTFSDGKLFTRSKKRGNVRDILSLLVQHGASPDILIDAHPHIGSDRLPHVIKAIRKTITDCGGEVLFNTKATSLAISENPDGVPEVCGVMLADGSTLQGPVILATGHSARDVYRFLHEQHVKMLPKGLAIGVRLEHPQHTIDCIQYHSSSGRGQWLPPAEYNFVARCGDRGVYSFCMCPGGVIVPASSAPGEAVVNGMSGSARAGHWANSGMVVEIHPGDIEGYSEYKELEMLALQEDLEKKFYRISDSIKAPAQRMRDFTEGKLSKTLPPSSYLPGLESHRLDLLLPDFISSRLKEGFRSFGRKAKGFLTNDATMVGLESRTSSPVRIPRDEESLHHPDLPGLYPAGEGAGYAGGIVSAAIDGQRVMVALAATGPSLQVAAKCNPPSYKAQIS